MTSKRTSLESRQTTTQYESMSERWLGALSENDTLENMRLSSDIWTTEQWKRFFSTLTKKNIRATVEVSIYDRPLLPELCNMLRETGAEDQSELIERLADVIKLSTSIITVRFNAEEARKRNVFLRRLSVDVRDNYQLLRVSLDRALKGDIQAYEDWFDVLEVTRRNSGLLVRAAAFVSGARQDRYSARALELMFRHIALPEEVSTQASVSKADAAVMVHRALESIQDLHEYMRLSGVVRDRVVCSPCGGARVQLDNLDSHSWAAVRSYLTISDVKDPNSM
ncbi:hypothetical protein MTO96_006122 [Rhipicephalus appendiculatus]